MLSHSLIHHSLTARLVIVCIQSPCPQCRMLKLRPPKGLMQVCDSKETGLLAVVSRHGSEVAANGTVGPVRPCHPCVCARLGVPEQTASL